MFGILQVLGSGCGRDNPAPAPDVLSPLEDNAAHAPVPDGDDPWPEVLSIVSGGDSELWWAHAVGFVKGTPEEVWTAARDPEVGVDRREVDAWTLTEVEDDFDASYIVHNTVNDVITVNYDLRWLHELQGAEPDDPLRVVAVWEKTEGTSFIELLQGSIVLLPESPGVTRIELVEHLEAPLRDDQTLVSYLQDFHGSLVAAVRGDPLPTWSE